MDSNTQTNDIPTALPGFEDEDAREKLLLEPTVAKSEIDSDDDDEADILEEKGKPPLMKKRGWQVMRMIAGFAVFVGILAFAVSWFFGMGSFAESQAQPVSRNAAKDTPVSPVTEDEKLKMALSLVAAANESGTGGISDDQFNPQETAETAETAETSSTAGTSVHGTSPVDDIYLDSGITTKASTGAGESPYALPPSSDTPARKESGSETSKPVAVRKETPVPVISRTDPSIDVPGRSLFFGVTRKPPVQANPMRISENAVPNIPIMEAPQRGIPFGTLLPVRLVGSIYTLRNSGGFVRMELTRPVEGEGFSYPAGTTVIGNVRGGESVRAFVTIIGLIDPVSGGLVKFSGELLGKEGASGIEGKRRRLTSQWSRFLSGLKDTASSVLGSVGALRSGGTVILSEPLRRGSESMSEDLSDALLGNGKDQTTFIEVSAGANGYVLVTDLPDATSATTGKLKTEATER
ncbi:MAG: hypothetical protein KF762_07060 [Acidobacteria bacterium]|nr:hypothetical protein [Acidobacteriota bacterium]